MLNRAPLSGITVAVCPYGRVSCRASGSDPAVNLPSGVTATDGWTPPISLSRSYQADSFVGHLIVLGPDLVDSISYLDHPVTRSLSLWRVFLTKLVQQGVEQIYEVSRDDADPRGDLNAVFIDCGGRPVSGVHIESTSALIDDRSRIIPDPDGSGKTVAILNVRPGLLEVRSVLDATGVETSRWQLLIEPNTNTFATLGPRPAE